MWTKGGVSELLVAGEDRSLFNVFHRTMQRRRCFGRFCCCTIMMTVFLIISIVLALAMVSPVTNILDNARCLTVLSVGASSRHPLQWHFSPDWWKRRQFASR